MSTIVKQISLVTKIHNNHIPIESFLSQTTRNQDGSINYQSLGEVLRTYGFDNVLSKRALSEIPTLSTPVVIFLENNEAAVINKIEHTDERIYHILEDTGLEHTIKESELAEKFLGIVWFIKPKPAQDVRSELPEYHLPKAWFWKVIWRFKSYYYQIILATFIINFLALVSSLYVMNVYDRVIPNKTYETLWALSIGVILAITFELVTKLIRGRLTDIAGKKADLIISAALFRRVMSLKMIDKPASSGSYANNLREFESVREFMTSSSLLVLVDLPFILLFVFVIYLVGGALALVPLIIIPIVIIVGIAIQPKISKAINESMREASQRQGLSVEAISNIETLKVNNATNWAQQRWDQFTAKTAASQIKIKDLSNFITSFTVAMQQLTTVFLVLVGTYLIHSENEASRITMGALIASVILSGRALSPLGQIANLANRFQQARLALKGINDIIEKPIERDPDLKYITLDNINGDINLNDVTFQYNKENKPALNNINLSIKAGERIGILGSIGSGKSTLLKLIAGLYEPDKNGLVTLDHIDMRQLEPSYLREQVSLLGQSSRLFLGTIRENLDLARQGTLSNDAQLMNALGRFGLHKLIQSHPRGLEMQLGENGQGLSGGQKQMLALARLTLKNPKVVLLDEPTSELDQSSENLALYALDKWIRNKTLIVVTHRPQVLQLVDRVILMDQGRILLDGPRDAVLAKLSSNNKPNSNEVSTENNTSSETKENKES